MSPDEFDDLASLYFDEALPPDRVEELNRLLATRPDLAARFVRLSRIHAGLREVETLAGAARPRRSLAWIPGAAAAVVLLSVLILLLRPEPDRGATLGRPEDPEALLVVGRVEPLAAGDAALRDRLLKSGFRVTPVKDAIVDAAGARQSALLVISESIVSAELGNRLADVAVPILNCEPNLNPGLGLAARAAAPGEVFLRHTQTTIRVSDPAHELAGGLGGPLTVYAGRPGFVAWGVPVGSARVVARCDTPEAEAAIFAVEAPSRRVGFFLPANTDEAARLTPEGWRLFDAAVRWLK